jgi:hypothetical protein
MGHLPNMTPDEGTGNWPDPMNKIVAAELRPIGNWPDPA